MTYASPLRDQALDLNHVAGTALLMQTGAFPGYDEETQAAVLEAAGRFARGALAGATPHLKLLGDTIGGWMLANGALAALRVSDPCRKT